MFAPGHIGELTQQVPFELVDAVLTETGRVQQQLPVLPSRVGVYFVLALGLCAHLGQARVWDKLVGGLAGLPGLGVALPSEKALRDLRRRVGPAPVKALFEVLAGPLAGPHAPGVGYRGWRTVAFDGCSSLKAPDANRSWLGKIKHRMGWAGYPMVQLMCLVETGTRGLLGAAFGPTAAGETTYAQHLIGLLDASMLVLADRGFDANTFLAAVAGTRAQFLVRAKSTRRPPVLAVLPDGSWLTRVGGLKLRVIDAAITVTGADVERHRHLPAVHHPYRSPRRPRRPARPPLSRAVGDRVGLLRAAAHPAGRAGTALRRRTGPTAGTVGAAGHLPGAAMAITSAAEAGGLDPDRASFTIALEAARDTLTTATGILPDDHHPRIDLVGVIGRAVLADPLPARRARYSARKVKSPISRYHARPGDDNRPLVTTSITAVMTQIHQPLAPDPVAAQTVPTPTEPASSRRRPRRGRTPRPRRPRRPLPTTTSSTHAVPPHPQAPTAAEVLDLLRSDSDRAWHGGDIARRLGVTNINSFCTRMSQWAHKGLLNKIGPATYTLATTT